MGTFRVGCRDVNVADPKKAATVDKLLVDTGSDYTWLPTKVLEKIGVERVKKDIVLTMANGQSITRSAGYAILHSDKFQTVDEVIFAEPGDLLLFVARTLRGFNARVDSKRKKLVAAGPILAAGASGDTRGRTPVLRGRRCLSYCEVGSTDSSSSRLTVQSRPMFM